MIFTIPLPDTSELRQALAELDYDLLLGHLKEKESLTRTDVQAIADQCLSARLAYSHTVNVYPHPVVGKRHPSFRLLRHDDYRRRCSLHRRQRITP